MKVRTSGLTGAALDYACAIAAGFTYTMRPISCEVVYAHPSGEYHFGNGWCPSTNWAQGGPIIERECIDLVPGRTQWFSHGVMPMYAPTPLIAAMRCFVANKLGDEVEVPDELLKFINLGHIHKDSDPLKT